ncbi:MAG: cell wall-binding repeat-containing protein [Gracilibacteraceae bacterium]|nr:cell wall-binding repeat-containing protein [Gracilibacteraceae bacterium]
MLKKCAALLLGMTLTLWPAGVGADDSVFGGRLAGNDRIATALAICAAGWDASPTVILAAADQGNLVDSLAAASLAGQENAPILLTYKNTLALGVKARIQALGARTVYLVGAVGDAVGQELRSIDGLRVEKLAGSDRWATERAVNAKLTGVQGTFIVGYNAIPDALSIASYAAAHRFQILLANRDGTVDETRLTGTAYIVGGSAVVRDIAGVARLGGADRYATNAAVIAALDFQFNQSFFASGASPVDALAASSLAARSGSPVFLTQGAAVPALKDAAVISKIPAAMTVIALGGAVEPGMFNPPDATPPPQRFTGESEPETAVAPQLYDLPAEVPAPAQEAEPEPAAAATTVADIAKEVFDLCNAERVQNGLQPYVWDDSLYEAARIRAAEIIQLFEHTRPDGSSCFTALEEVGLVYASAGENIAAGYLDAAGAVNGWMNSPGHKANILNNFEYMAVGVVKREDYGYAFVQMFYTPQ